MPSTIGTVVPITPLMADNVQTRAGFRRDQTRRGLSPRTINERDKVLDLLGRSADDIPLVGLDRDRINEWLDTRRITPRSRSNYLSALHMFFAWCVDEGHAPSDPTVRIRRPLLARSVPRPISDDDLHVAISGAPPRLRAMMCLAANEGFRCMDIAGLRREDVMDRHRPPVLRVWKGKGGHQAILPLNPETASALRVLGLPARGYVFTRDDGVPLKPATVSKLGNKYLHGLGIDATMHQLRHWFGTAVWKLTKDMRVTQELMRHSHPGTTAGYVAFDNDAATNAVVHVHQLRRRSDDVA